MKLDLSRFRSRFDDTGEQESTLRGYRLDRITAREGSSLTVYEASVASTGERLWVRAFPLPEETRLRKQARSVAKKRVAVRHPNVLRARDAFEDGGLLYLVTEISEAPTLASLLERGPLAPALAVRVLSGVSDGVEAVQAGGVTDSLLSPAGILVDAPEHVMLTDVGSATSLSQLVQPWAHPHATYFSPELGQGEHLGARTSVYSIGCILFETLTGSPPYEGNWLNLSDLHSAEPIPAVSQRRPELGTAIDAVIARALAEDPSERFSSPGELAKAAAAALKDVKESEPEPHLGTVPMSAEPPTGGLEPERDAAERAAEAEREASATARREAEVEAEREADAAAAREAEAAAQREAEGEVKREAEAAAAREAEGAAQREAEAAAQREAQAEAKREAEAAAAREAEAAAQRKAQAEARRRADAEAKRETEAEAEREAEAIAQREAEAAAHREAEGKAKRERSAEAKASRKAKKAGRREAAAAAASQRTAEVEAGKAKAAAQSKAEADARHARPARRRAQTAQKPTTRTRAPVASADAAKGKPGFRRGRAVLLGCSLMGALALGGYLIGEAGAPSSAPAELAAAGPLSFELPSGWERRPAAGALPGVRLDTAIGAGPRGSEETGVVAGRTAGGDLLPPGLDRRGGPAPEPVHLGRFDAYRYRGMRVAGSAREIVTYSVPTADGAAIIACYAAPRASLNFMRKCERVASTLQLRDVQAISVSALVTENRRLAEIRTDLSKRRSADRRLLARARTPRGQARRSKQLQLDYRDARRSLERTAAKRDSPNREALVRAMKQVERTYAALARATAKPSPADYNAARRAVDRAEGALAPLLARPAA